MSTNRIPILGISGNIGSGKDTVSDYLVSNHGFVKIAFADEMKRILARVYPHMSRKHLWGSSKRRNEPIFDYPTKSKTLDYCLKCKFEGRESELYLLSDVWVCSAHGEQQFYLTARYALQQLNCFRSCYEDTMVDLTINAISKIISGEKKYSQFFGLSSYIHDYSEVVRGIVVPDVRWVLGNEGQAIRNIGGFLLKMKRQSGNTGSVSQHESETVMKDAGDKYFDMVADNQDWNISELAHFVDDIVIQVLRGQ